MVGASRAAKLKELQDRKPVERGIRYLSGGLPKGAARDTGSLGKVRGEGTMGLRSRGHVRVPSPSSTEPWVGGARELS